MTVQTEIQSAALLPPWHVYTDTGHFRSGHPTESEATAVAGAANERAKALGIETRYVARARP